MDGDSAAAAHGTATASTAASTASRTARLVSWRVRWRSGRTRTRIGSLCLIEPVVLLLNQSVSVSLRFRTKSFALCIALGCFISLFRHALANAFLDVMFSRSNNVHSLEERFELKPQSILSVVIQTDLVRVAQLPLLWVTEQPLPHDLMLFVAVLVVAFLATGSKRRDEETRDGCE